MYSLRNYWDHKGHAFGKCHTHPNSDWFWINIPKNASSFTQTLLAHELLWYEHNFYQEKFLNKLAWVVIRDPVDRWLSGMAEYISRYHKTFDLSQIDHLTLDLIFDRVAFDDHTESQVYFFDGLDRSNIRWFWFDNTYENKLISWMQSIDMLRTPYQIPNQVREFSNATSEDLSKSKMRKGFTDILYDNKQYQTKIKNYFTKDYQLIDSVKFI